MGAQKKLRKTLLMIEAFVLRGLILERISVETLKLLRSHKYKNQKTLSWFLQDLQRERFFSNWQAYGDKE